MLVLGKLTTHSGGSMTHETYILLQNTGKHQKSSCMVSHRTVQDKKGVQEDK
jgi:hypothetical protein